jgi:hypothetical protein
MTDKIQELNDQVAKHGGRRMASNDQDTQARIKFPSRKAAREFANRAREIGAGAQPQGNPNDVVVTIR